MCLQDIHRDNVQDFVTFSLFCCTYEQLTPAQHQQADDFIDRIEDVWGFKCALCFNVVGIDISCSVGHGVFGAAVAPDSA